LNEKLSLTFRATNQNDFAGHKLEYLFSSNTPTYLFGKLALFRALYEHIWVFREETSFALFIAGQGPEHLSAFLLESALEVTRCQSDSQVE